MKQRRPRPVTVGAFVVFVSARRAFQRCKPRRELRCRRVRELAGGRVVGKRRHLLAHGIGDLGAAVAHVHHGEAGIGVEQLPSLAVPDPYALAALDHQLLVGPGRMILSLVGPQVLDHVGIGHGSLPEICDAV